MEQFRSLFFDVELKVDTEIPAYIINPKKESLFYRLWMLCFFVIVPIELLLAPFLVFAPYFIDELQNFLWTLDTFWIISMGL